MTNPQKFCAHKSESDEFLLAIGKLAVDAAALDYWLSALKGVIEGIADGETPSISADFAANKCKQIRRAAETRSNRQIVDLMDRVEKIIEVRNLHIHGVHILPLDSDRGGGLAMLRGPFTKKITPRSIEDLNKAIDELGLIVGEIVAHIRCAAPHFYIGNQS